MTTALGAAGSSTPAYIINGLESGITTSQVITALLARYEQPITNLTNEQAAFKTQISALRSVNTDFQALLTAAQALAKKSSWDFTSATSSDTSVATAVSSSGAQLGSLTFTVTQLAQADMIASANGVASPSSKVTTATSMIIGMGTAATGFTSFTPAAGTPYGTFTITVTQASQSAVITGNAALATRVTVKAKSGYRTRTAGNDKLTITIDGTTHSITVTAGTYTKTSLVAELNTKLTSYGVTASLTSTGNLELTTKEQGSKASIAFRTSGTSILGSLGLTRAQTAAGTSAITTVGGHKTTLTAITPGGTVKVSLGSGATTTVTAVVGTTETNGSLITTGTIKIAHISTGTGTLTAVVSAINSSGLPLTASEIKTSSGSYVLQVEADTAGAKDTVYLTAASFGAGGALGSFKTIQAGQTAEVQVGGSNGYTVSSSTDTFTGLMQGTTITVASLGTTTVTVGANATGQATAVNSFVTAANALLTAINKYTSYTKTTGTAGALLGNPIVEHLRSQVLADLAVAKGTSSLADLKTAGISLNQTGTLAFTRTKFIDAYKKTADAVASLFSQGGSFASKSATYTGIASVVEASTTTPSGTYAVKVNAWATQAFDTGRAIGTGGVTKAETLTITSGSTSVQYTTTVGETAAQIAAGLDTVLAGADLKIGAYVTGGKAVLRTTAYGTDATFSVKSNLTGPGGTGLAATRKTVAKVSTGTNVTGTIGGQKATGIGQTLTAQNGLEVLIAPPSVAPPTGTIGSIAYTPGVAQQLATISSIATTAESGSLTGQVKALTNESVTLTPQINLYKQLKSTEHAVLVQQFAKMEATLGRLKNEGNSLSSQIAKLG